MKLRNLLFIVLFILLFLFLSGDVYALTFTDNTSNNTGEYVVPNPPDDLSSYLTDNYIVYVELNNDVPVYYIFYSYYDSNSFFYHDVSRISFTADGNYMNSLTYTVSTSKWKYDGKVGNRSIPISHSSGSKSWKIIYYNANIYTDVNKTSLWFDNNSVINPYIMNTKDNLTMLDIDTLMIDSGNVDIEAGYFDFIVSVSSQGSSDSNVVYTTKLDSTSDFYRSGGLNGDYYEIPVSVFKKFLSQGDKVEYILLYKLVGSDTSDTDTVSVVYGGVVDNPTDNILNSGFNKIANIMSGLNDTFEKSHKESEETQKGILNTIKQVIGFINPLSENFFVYKLIDLLLDLLIKVFVPSSEFFSEWFSDLNEYFGDRFGMLYYPFELIVDILNRVKNLTSSLNGNFVLKTPNLDIFGTTLIPAYEFNFNEFLQNETFKTVYDVYLTSVDVILICCLVILCKNTFVEVFGGRFVDDVVDTVQKSRGGNEK